MRAPPKTFLQVTLWNKSAGEKVVRLGSNESLPEFHGWKVIKMVYRKAPVFDGCHSNISSPCFTTINHSAVDQVKGQ